MTESNDTAVKYQRLAQEYAKLKAQNQVLKKAVLEAQDGQEKLQSNIQDKEQVIRRLQQEIDSSNFRSQQMARRIELLQIELDHKEKKSKTIDKNYSSASNVIDEDLKQKIMENEQLHKSLHECDTEKRQMEQRFVDELSSTKEDARMKSEALEALRQTYSEVTEQLQNDKLILQNQIEMLNLDLKQSSEELNKKLEGFQAANDQLELSVAQLTFMIHQTIVFNDHDQSDFNHLKILPYNKRLKIQANDLFKAAKNLTDEFFKSLKDFHSHTKQRVSLYPIDATIQPLPEASLQLSQSCAEATPIIDKIISAFHDAFKLAEISQNEGILKLEDFAKCFEKYGNLFSKLLPYQLTCLEEEHELSVCVPALQDKNSDFQTSFKKCLPSLKKLSTYLTYVTSIKSQSDPVDHTEKVKFASQKIISSLNELHLLFKELSKAFNGKIALESQLPTTSTAPELKSANEFLLGSMLSMSSMSAKLSGFLQTNIDFISKAITTNKNSVISKIVLTKKSFDFMDKVNISSPPPSVNYKEAIERNQDLQSENREELVYQLQDVTNKLRELEREKEHWLLETQLLQMKLEKVKSYENKLDETATERNRVESLSLAPVETTMLGSVDMSIDTIHISKSTEELIKEHLTSRVSEAALKAQTAEGKALHFENECRMLHKHLTILQKKKHDLHSEVDTGSQRVSQLQDELSVTRRSYEDQLSLMSEHLTTMNDKLAAQKDEIEMLKNKTKNSRTFRLH